MGLEKNNKNFNQTGWAADSSMVPVVANMAMGSGVGTALAPATANIAVVGGGRLVTGGISSL